MSWRSSFLRNRLTLTASYPSRCNTCSITPHAYTQSPSVPLLALRPGAHAIFPAVGHTTPIDLLKGTLGFDLSSNLLVTSNLAMEKGQTTGRTNPCGLSNSCASSTTSSAPCGQLNPCPTGAIIVAETNLATMLTAGTCEIALSTLYLCDESDVQSCSKSGLSWCRVSEGELAIVG